MSAKEAYARPPIHLPKLPAEIWILILKLATLSPETLDHLTLNDQLRVASLREEEKLFRQSLVG